MIKKLLMLMALCLTAVFAARAEKQVYTSFDSKTGTLTYYYDDQRSSRPKTEIYEPYNTRFKDYAEDVRKGKIDVSMKDAPLTSTKYMFYGNSYFSCSTSGLTETWTSHTVTLYNMKEIEGLENLNTSWVTDMSGMFLECSALRTIDFGKVDTRNVTNMGSMFSGCYNLTSLNITSFNTAKVTNMSSMFSRCISLPSIDLRSFDIANVKDMSYMFSKCSSLKTILCDDDWSRSEVLKDAKGMFGQCASLAGGCGTACDGENMTGPDYARPDEGDKRPGYFTKQEIYTVFDDKTKTLTYYCDGARLSRPGIAEVYDPVGEPDANRFKEYHQLVKKAKIDPSMKNARLTSMANMFFGNEEEVGNTTVRYSLSEMTEISGMEHLNTEDVRSMEYMFNYCSSLTSVNLLSFHTAKLKYANRMFFGCTKLTTVFCNGDWSASDVLEYSGSMFGGCVSLRGGKGTVCDGEANIDKTCAVQDGLDGKKGYFTSVNEVYTSFDAQTGTLTYYCDNIYFGRKAMGDIVELYDPVNAFRKARFEGYSTKVKKAVIDDSMKDTLLTSTRRMFFGGSGSVLSSLQEISGLENLKTDEVTDMSYMFYDCESLKSLDVSGFNTSNVTDMSNMFADCESLKSLDVSGFNTSNVTDMSYMFHNCVSLKSLDVSGFNTANVTEMICMFKDCYSLKSIDVSGFNTANVTNMNGMFADCHSLESIDVSGFNTANVTDMGTMFSRCESLKTLDLRHFNTSKVKNFSYMFYVWESTSLTTILCNDDWSKNPNVEKSTAMFWECKKLKGGRGTSYDKDHDNKEYARPDGIGGRKGYFTAVTQAYTVFDEATGTLTYYYDDQQAVHDGTIEAYTPGTGRKIVRFTGYADKVKKAVIDASFKNATMTSLSHMFDGGSEETRLSALETIEGMENINYTPVTSTYEMFNGCASLKTIDLDWFSPANLTIMEGMFAGCSSLETLNLVHFNTSDVTSMYRLFEGCSSLKSVNLDSFDTSEVGSMIAMFKGCSSLEKLDLRLFDTGNVTVMMSMFDGCSSLKSLDLKTFNISNVTDMAWMFDGCSSLESIDLRSFKTVSATSMSYMFKDCRKLAFLDLGSFNTTNVKDMIRMFAGCTSLKTVYANSDWGKSTILVNSEGMFEGCTSLVGGNGTKCDGTNNTGKTYARIDNGESAPGYFTVNNEVYTAYDAETGTLTYYYDNLRLFRTEQTELYDPKDNTTVRFKDYCDKVLVVEIDESMQKAELTSMHNMFFGGGEYDENLDYVRYPLTNAAEIDGLEYLNTEKVTDMNGMFYRCASIDSLDLSSFNTGNVTDMKWMFSGCTKLATIRCKFHWDESGKLEQSEKMFEGCTSLVGEKGTKCDGVNNIDKAYARPDNGEKAPGYFTTIKEQYTVFNEETATLTYYYDDKCLEREGIVEMYTPTKGDAVRFEGYAGKVKKAVIHKSYRHLIKKSLACMFYGGTSSTCLAAMESVEGLENLRTEKVTDVHDMFLGCRSLKEVDVTPLITSKVKNFRRMFFECASLKELNVDGFDIRKATNMTNMFANCTSLTTIWNENSWKMSGVVSYDMFNNCPALVGGHGSEYDESHCDNEYARPDEGRKKPGYFTMTPHLERRFTVSENGDQIRFSPGNLQYNPTNNKWRFAPNQWNYMWQSNQDVWSITYSGWLDLFGWGTGNDPLSANTNGSEYASYTEWGKNKIGSDARNTWRAPTTAEWDYIFNKRADASSKYGAAKVNDVGGLVILPDLWELPADCKFTPGMVTGAYDWYYATNVYSTTQWEKMEKAGAIFLPAGGYRYYNGDKHVYTDNVGHYWTSTPTNDIFYRAYDLYFTAYSLDAEKTFGRHFGCSVRLVKDIRDIPDFTLTLTTEGSGTVTGAGRYMQDEEATLTAKAGDGWEFVRWSDGNTDNPRQITMTADLTLTAVFEEIPVPDFTLTLTTAGEGTVTGAGTYKQGEVVTITATPDEGYGFSQWSDGSTDAWRQITIRSNMTLTAVFQIRSYDLTVNVEGEGTVTGAGTYTHNEVITLEATAGKGYEFSQWSDGNTDNPRLITITGNTDITAVFTPVQLEVYTAFNAETGILTYYYNDQRAARTAAGEITELYDPVNNPDALDYRWEYSLQITKVKVDVSMKDAHLKSMTCMFNDKDMGLLQLTEIEGIENLVTDEVTDMSWMFDGCTNLTSLDVSHFNTENVTDIRGMFNRCSSLTSLDVSKFNTANVTNMRGMFSVCKSLTSLDVSHFNTENVTDMSFMFDGCKSLTSLDLSMFNTDNVTIMREMFRTCSALKTILCNEDWSKSKLLTSSDNMFDGCTSLVGGNGTKYDANHTNIAYARPDGEDGKPGYFFKKQTEVYTAFNAATGILTYYYNDQRAARTAAGEITELYDPVNNPDALDYRWGEYHLQITKIKVDVSMKDAHLTSTYCMFCQGFSGLTNMTEIEGIENLVTDEVKDMKCMFMNCTALTSLNLSSFNTANVTDMFGMFAQCFALTSLDVSKFNTANVTDMTGMFNACKSLTSLDLSMFNTDNVTGMRDMFRTCSVLKTILCNEDWSKSEVLTNSNNMFRDCNSLVGGSGTKYDANHFGIEYARPDGEDGKPGYFTSNAQLKPLPNDETTTFDFSLIDNQTNQELLGITLGAKDEYNATEGCMQISTTNTEEEIDAKLNAAFAGAASFKSLLPGTITFRLNAGQGSIIIDCRTNPGYTLVVRIAEYGTAYISSTKEQVERGKATVNYNVTQDTYVVIYLESSPSASTPARIAKSDEDEEAGAYIYSIQIKPVSTGLETTENDSRDTRKLLINGHLYILRDGRLHTVTGMEMR